MTEENKSVKNFPNLRFPGFEEAWKCTNLGNCAHSFEYGMNASAIKFDGENRYIRITDIDESSSKYKPEFPVSPNGQLIDKYLVCENDILFARTGASTGKSYLYYKEDGKLYFAGFLIRAKIKEEFNSYFVFTQTKTIQYYKWIQLMSMRSGQPGINSQEYASYSFNIPSRNEQDKIASFLLLVDERIQTQKKIIEGLITLKIQSRNKLFTQIIKGNYETFTVEEILNYEQPTKYIVSNTDYSSDKSLIPVLTANKAFILGYTDENWGIYNKGKCIVLDDFTMDLKYVDFPFKVKSSAIKLLTPKNNVDLKFIFEYFSFLNLSSNEHKRHYISEIQPMFLTVPSLEIQICISDFLLKLDEKVNLETALLNQYENQKKYLLQNLFV